MLEFLDIDEEDVKNFHKRIVENVKRVRKSKNITQSELANVSGNVS